MVEEKDKDFHEVLLSFKEINKELSQIHHHKKSVLIIGSTGAGKSTLINYLCGKTLQSREIDGKLVLDCQDPISPIGHAEFASETSTPWHHSFSDVTYWDCPGFGDTKGPRADLENLYGILRIGSEDDKIKILGVIQENCLSSPQRGKPFRDFVSKINKMFIGEVRVENSLMFCFTKAGIITDYKAFIQESIIEKVITSELFTEEDKALLKSVVEKEGYCAFSMPEEPGPILFEERVILLDKISRLDFIDKSNFIMPLSYDLSNYMGKFLAYLSKEVYVGIGYVRKFFKDNADGGTVIKIKNNISAISVETEEVSKIMKQIIELADNNVLTEQLNDTQFILKEIFEFFLKKVAHKEDMSEVIKINQDIKLLPKEISELIVDYNKDINKENLLEVVDGYDVNEDNMINHGSEINLYVADPIKLNQRSLVGEVNYVEDVDPNQSICSKCCSIF